MLGGASRSGAFVLAVLLPLMGCAGEDGAAGSGGFSGAAYGGDAGGLIGLETSQVTRLLGPADFRRADGPAEILQYRGGTCVLDLYLYRDPATGQYLVKHIEARDRSFTRIAPDACLSNVARNKRAHYAG
jgi:hypothetical protein